MPGRAVGCSSSGTTVNSDFIGSPPTFRGHLGRMCLRSLVTVLGMLAAGVPAANAAGIVTHAWMGLEAIGRVQPTALRQLLEAHRSQVRAGAEFPDGGYWTRSLGTPGGDYGEEAHWQRFHDAYVAQIRSDPACAPLTNPAGPCAAMIAHLMGAAAHGMGDEVWDWLFEPNGPGFDESYLPPELAFLGTGGLEAQLDIVAIARHARPIGATPAIPNATKIDAAFASVGRSDIDPAAFTQGDALLDAERGVEASWAPRHIQALERAMPWTSAHVIEAAGGIDFAADAIARYYETLWGDLLGNRPPTRVAAMAPFDGQLNVPASGWTGGYSPGSNPGNHGGLTRIAAALSSALPYRAQAGQGSLPNELPADALRLRDLESGQLVAPAGGYPRIVPYNPEAGEHVIAFQPAGDLAPCRWYQVETTTTLVDARQQPVTPATWRFQTSGCGRGTLPRPIQGTITCDATGSFTFPAGLTMASDGTRAHGRIALELTACDGGQNGAQRPRSSLPMARGTAELEVVLAASSCAELTTPSGAAKIRGRMRWLDAQGRPIGVSFIKDGDFDVRGDVVTLWDRARVFPSHALALRIAPAVGGCGAGGRTVLPVTSGKVTAWPR
jgi:hypothetical protein